MGVFANLLCRSFDFWSQVYRLFHPEMESLYLMKFAETLQEWDVCKHNWKISQTFAQLCFYTFSPLPMWPVWKLRRWCRNKVHWRPADAVWKQFHKKPENCLTQAWIKKTGVQMTSEGKAASIVQCALSNCFYHVVVVGGGGEWVWWRSFLSCFLNAATTFCNSSSNNDNNNNNNGKHFM